VIDDQTTNLLLPLPHQTNDLADDVLRLRSALTLLDTAVNNRAVLDGGGKVSASQLPSYVDDVLEYANFAALPGTGDTGKIYTTLDTNKTYRWSGSAYVEISASPGSTDAVTEGVTNLYFTPERALAAVPVATASTVGKVKPGSGLSVSGDGTLSVDGAGQTFEDVVLAISTNGQTVFTTAYTVGAIDLHLNGVLLAGGGDDYTASNGTSITLTAGVNTTDSLVVRKWATFDVANTYTQAQTDALLAALPLHIPSFASGII
jgi:hypothetical protein